MNREYHALMSALALPDCFAELATGKLRSPFEALVAVKEPQAFPPVFIPFLAGRPGSDYYGYWMHWFGPRRGAYVSLNLGDSRFAFEVARSPQQFVAYLLLQGLVTTAKPTKKLRAFATAMGYPDFDVLYDHFQAYTDDPAHLSRLPEYRDQLPAYTAHDVEGYSGDFPHVTRPASSYWNDCCSFEIDPEQLDKIRRNRRAPHWLRPRLLEPLFDRYCKDRQAIAAWYTLNSAGWDIEAGREALSKLCPLQDNAAFGLLVEAYASSRFETRSY